MFKYAAIFLIVQLVMSFVLNTVLDAVGNSFSASLVPSVLAGSFVAGYIFARDHLRVPEASESHRYGLVSLIMLWVCSLGATVVVLNTMSPQVDLGGLLSLLGQPVYLALLSGFAVVVSLILYFANRWGFGWMARYRVASL